VRDVEGERVPPPTEQQMHDTVILNRATLGDPAESSVVVACLASRVGRLNLGDVSLGSLVAQAVLGMEGRII
jgi:hypothetical protein